MKIMAGGCSWTLQVPLLAKPHAPPKGQSFCKQNRTKGTNPNATEHPSQGSSGKCPCHSTVDDVPMMGSGKEPCQEQRGALTRRRRVHQRFQEMPAHPLTERQSHFKTRFWEQSDLCVAAGVFIDPPWAS